jgi:hypothetical protein
MLNCGCDKRLFHTLHGSTGEQVTANEKIPAKNEASSFIRSLPFGFYESSKVKERTRSGMT